VTFQSSDPVLDLCDAEPFNRVLLCNTFKIALMLLLEFNSSKILVTPKRLGYQLKALVVIVRSF
jgi:hypothetical protein